MPIFDMAVFFQFRENVYNNSYPMSVASLFWTQLTCFLPTQMFSHSEMEGNSDPEGIPSISPVLDSDDEIWDF